MAKSTYQKQKLLYIAKYLMEHTDENHMATTADLITYLANNNINAERKSIYDDINTLIEFGFDIGQQKGSKCGYYMNSREFELAEVKLLVDLVQAAKFITTKKSRELTQKLEKQVSTFEAQALRRQLVVSDRSKAINEKIYYSVDKIYEAIAKNVKVRYHYFEWDVNANMKLRKDGEYYEVSPWILIWEDENYYLIAFDDEANKMKYYRVDKMLDIDITKEMRQGKEVFDQKNVKELSKRTFGMFGGEEKTIQLLCSEQLTGVIIDRFGTDVAIREYDKEHVLARVNVEVSSQFFGWLAGFEDRMKIISPSEIVEKYKGYIAKILEAYKDS